MPLLNILPGMSEGEKILEVSRKSFLVFSKKIFLFVLLAVLPAAFSYAIFLNFPNILNGYLLYPIIILGASAYYLFIWLFLLFSFNEYYLSFIAVTTERIIIIRQKGFFSRIISEQKIENVEDVTSDVSGIFRTLFQYGDINIQTAAEQEKFNFSEVSHPGKIRDIIAKEMERKETEK